MSNRYKILGGEHLYNEENLLAKITIALKGNGYSETCFIINSQKVLDNNLADPYYKYEASIVLAELGRIELSEIQIKKLSISDPRNLYFLDWLVSTEIRKANYESALKMTLQMEKFDPWNVKNMLLTGELYKQLGDLSKMEEIRLKINKIAPNSDISMQANQILI